ncbi:MAG: 4-hydroxy-tetrahydrodipicolinate synthase [Bacteroidales bacterium]|nr:4-hydroxy-tetrahydrodipicolinate synthase [Bacteroidales bacterium]
MHKNFQGTGVAIVTPFLQNGNIDFDALGRLLEHIITGGVDFVVALGTTSEAVTLSTREKNEVMAFVKEKVNGRLPIVMGLGGNNTAALVEQIKSTDFNGIDGILSVAPYYNKPNQRGLYEHFNQIATASPVPIILYNVPGRTSSNIQAKTVLKLAGKHTNIVAVKEASGDLNQVMEIINNKTDDFNVLSGDDALTFPMMTLGAKGVISVVANAFPAEFSQMVNHLLEEKIGSARTLHYSLLEIINQLFADGNPAGIKAALSHMGICGNILRLPMVSVDEMLFQKLKDSIAAYRPSL